MIHQELSLVPELSVAENICLGAEPARGGVVDRAAGGDGRARCSTGWGRARLRPGMPGRCLPLAARQMTEIAKAWRERAAC